MSRFTSRCSSPNAALRVDTLTLLQHTRATSDNLSALDLVFDHEDYFNYRSPSYSHSELEMPERPYGCASRDLGQAKAGFGFSLRSLSFRKGSSIRSGHSPLRECYYPDMAVPEPKEKRWGLGALLSSLSRRRRQKNAKVSGSR